MEKKNNLSEIAAVFFKMGCFAFGGPAAHIALMEAEIVAKRKWMTREHFLDLIGATNLIPGPNSTEMTMHCGHERGGFLGLFIAGLSFIFPAIVITGVIAFFYVEYGHLPVVAPFIYGIKPAVLAIILSAVIKLGKKAIKGLELAVLGAAVVVLCLLGFNEIAVLFGAGIIGTVYFHFKNSSKGILSFFAPFLFLQISTSAISQVTSLKIFWTFLKVGAVLYGSGYVLFAYLDAELVSQGWLTRQELMDAIAVGQFTPGPVLSTATFIGYQMGGLWGALGATAGIFLPSFLFVLVLNPFIPKMRKSKVLGYFLDSVNVASVALMIAVLVTMSIETLVDWRAIVILSMALVVTFVFKKINAIWLIIGGASLGYLFYYF